MKADTLFLMLKIALGNKHNQELEVEVNGESYPIRGIKSTKDKVIIKTEVQEMEFDIDELINKCLIGEEHLDQAEYEYVGGLLTELKTLRKAYELMAANHCKNTKCYYCEVIDKCKLYLGAKKGCENLMEYFLTEAQKDE